MKIARLASLMLVAILAIGLAAASAASAAPLFTQTGATFTGTSTTGKLTAGTESITCAKDTFSGTVTSSTLVGGLTAHFLECTGKGSTGTECAAHSLGAPAGLIITSALHGVLGLILPKPASGSDIALVVLPLTQPFVKVLGIGGCILETAVEGSVAGLVEPVGKAVLAGTVEFGVTGGKQNIRDVDLSTGGLVKPILKAFGVQEATEETFENVTYSKDTEVM